MNGSESEAGLPDEIRDPEDGNTEALLDAVVNKAAGDPQWVKVVIEYHVALDEYVNRDHKNKFARREFLSKLDVATSMLYVTQAKMVIDYDLPEGGGAAILQLAEENLLKKEP